MAQSCDVNGVPPDDQTSDSNQLEAEQAKQYLQKFCPEVGNNLYDHLIEVLSQILAERPDNAFESFEEHNRRLRDDKFRTQNQHLRDLYAPPKQLEEAKKLIKLFKNHLPIDEDHQSLEEGEEDRVEEKTIIPNLFDLVHYTERADIGLPRTEIVLLNLSIRKLIASRKIKDVRFWGKVLGRPRNYYIIESSLSEEEMERRLQEMEKEEQTEGSESKIADKLETDSVQEKAALEAALATKLSNATVEDGREFPGNENTLQIEYPPMPENTWKPPPEVTPEKLGTGPNAKVYFVCNSPGKDNWVELPAVTPQQIVTSRQIVYLFTGNLEAQIQSFPPFPGNEKNYLRAQIARIGSATHVSPVGYFTFGNNQKEEDEEEEEEENDEDEEESEIGAGGNGLVINHRYVQLPMKALIDSSLSNWCHHSPYLLEQGRTVWQDPENSHDNSNDTEKSENDEENEDGNDEDEDENETEGNEKKDNGIEKEIGPPLLTPLSEDAASDFSKPWTARLSSNIQPDTAVAFIRSNIWPGAFAFAADNKFLNLYIGWGHKHNSFNYSPPPMPPVQDQYALDSELIEIQDPSFEEEEAYRISQLHADDSGEENEEASEETESDDED